MPRFQGGVLLLAVAALAACGGGGGGKQEPAVVLTACNPVAQTGCSAGKKCTWLRTSSATQTGAMACTPSGTVDVGGACRYGADGDTTGYDDCKPGLVCRASTTVSGAQGTCSPICDATSVLSCTPSSSFACSGYGGYFANSGTQPTAGLCDAQCNPLTQVRLSDGAAACGSPNPMSPTQGCYGLPSADSQPTVFTCGAAGPSSMTADAPIAGPVFTNSCAPGYLPLLVQSTGSTTPICVATCSPTDTSLESHPAPGGVTPYTCQAKGGAATEECRYWWALEGASTPASTWSNGLGYCLDYPNYTYGTPATQFPSCTTLSSSATAHNFDPTATDAQFWACTAR